MYDTSPLDILSGWVGTGSGNSIRLRKPSAAPYTGHEVEAYLAIQSGRVLFFKGLWSPLPLALPHPNGVYTTRSTLPYPRTLVSVSHPFGLCRTLVSRAAWSEPVDY